MLEQRRAHDLSFCPAGWPTHVAHPFSHVPVQAQFLAHAKINLGLHVLAKRDDGFHEIDTIMVKIGWADRLLITPSTTFGFTADDPKLPTDEGNLCVQAALAMAKAACRPLDVHIHLEKRVPYGAGLGSGSSDAATVLAVLNARWGDPLTPGDLAAIAAGLGSDVPFFLGGSVAQALGRGERLVPQPHRGPSHAVVVVPPIHVPTGKAYGWTVPCARPSGTLLAQYHEAARWRETMVNDFQAPVVQRFPVIEEVLNLLESHQAMFSALSGSGSAVFGLFPNRADVVRVSESIRTSKTGASCRIWAGPIGEALTHPG